MKKQATIKDVAKYAETSVGTVSNVLNGLRCSPKLRQRINDAIAALNYTPNLHAKAVRSSRTNCIGILVERCSEKDSPWQEFLVLESVKAISNHKYGCMIEYWDTKSRFMPQLLNNIDGLIAVGHYDQSFYDNLEKTFSHPVVSYWEDMNYSQGINIPVNIRGGAMKAVSYLRQLGHRKIGFVGGISNDVNNSKAEAFREALEQQDMAGDSCLDYMENLEGSHSDIGYKATLRMFEANPGVTAVFYSTDCYAIGGIGAIAALGLKIPEDISVMSLDDSGWARNTRPAITSLGFTPSLMPTMVDLLVKMIDTVDIPELRKQVQPAELDVFVRESTAFPCSER